MIVAEVPHHASGPVDVTVHTATLTSPTTLADKFTFIAGRSTIFDDTS
jgi:hypothetical protein